MTSIDVSVIIAAYNIEGYIARAVGSALGQTGVRIQVIVVDDCSTDATVHVLSTINDPRLEVLCLSQNSGPSAARNAGIRAAKGEWIAVLDGDDAMAPDRIHTLLHTARQENADIVVDNLMVLTDDTIENSGVQGREMFSKKKLEKNKILTLDQFIRHNQSFLGGYTFGYMKPMVRVAFLKKHGLSYDPIIRVGEDYMFMVSALALGARCVVVPRALYNYTVRKGSISHRLIPADINRIAACDDKIIAQYGALFSDAAWAAQRLRTKRIRSACSYIQLVEGIKKRNIGECRQAICASPLCVIGLWRPVAVRIMRLIKKGVGHAA